WQGPDNALGQRTWELIPFILAEETGEDLEAVLHSPRDGRCSTEEKVHLLAALGELVCEVHPRKCNVTGGKIVRRSRGIMDCGLSRERQYRDSIMTQSGLIFGDESDIAGEDDIAEFGQG